MPRAPLRILVALGQALLACGGVSLDLGYDEPAADAQRAGPNDASTSDAGVGGAACAADIGSDPLNCGACGHDCLGGACSAGACQPLGFALNQANAQGLFVAGTNVYFTNTGQNGSVKSCPRGGCGGAPKVLATGQAWPSAVLVVGTQVFWTNFGSGELMECTSEGCGAAPGRFTTVPRTAAGFGRLASDGATLFFSDAGNGRVHACSLVGCTAGPQVLTSSADDPWGVGVDGTWVFWVDDAAAGTVNRCPKSGCGANDSQHLVLAAAQAGPRTLALDATDVYWATQQGGTVMKCGKNGCSQQPTQLASGLSNPHGVAVDDTWVYFTERGTGSIKKVNKNGGPTLLVASGQSSPYNIVVDDTAIYWTNWANASTDSVMKIAK